MIILHGKSKILVYTALSYFIGAWLSIFFFSMPTSYVCGFWFPSAFAVIALLLGGWWAGVGLLIGRIAFDLSFTGIPQDWISVVSVLCLALFALTQASVSVGLIKRFVEFPISFNQPRPLFTIIFIAVFCSLISASLAVPLLWVLGKFPVATNLVSTWGAWFAGDALSVVLLLPALLVLFKIKNVSNIAKSLLIVLPVTILILSTWHYSSSLNDEAKSLLKRLEKSNQLIETALFEKFKANEQTLLMLSASVQNISHINEKVFSEITIPLLDLNTTIQALSWNQLVEQSENSPRTVRVKYIEPYATNSQAMGVDVYAEFNRRKAIDQAISTGGATITSRLRLKQETGDSWGLLAFNPVYDERDNALSQQNQRRLPLGFVVEVIRIERLIQSITKSMRFNQIMPFDDGIQRPETVAYRMVDMSAEQEDQVLWSSNWLRRDPEKKDSLSLANTFLKLPMPPATMIDLSMFGGMYQLQVDVLPEFWAINISARPFNAFLSTVIPLSVIMFGFIFFLCRQGSLELEVKRRTTEIEENHRTVNAALIHYREKSEQLRSIIDGTPVGYLACGQDGNIVISNHAFDEIVGVNEGNFPVDIQSLFSMIQINKNIDHARFDMNEWLEQSIESDEHHREINHVYVQKSNGVKTPIHLDWYSYVNGLVGQVILIVDETKQHLLEKSKSQFMMTAAHEVRAPLTIILGYSELLQARPTINEEIRGQYLKFIVEKSKEIDKLLFKLLELIELEQTDPTTFLKQKTQLNFWLEYFSSSYVPSYGKIVRHQYLNESESIMMAEISDKKLKIVLTELLDNAYRFSNEGSLIQIELKLSSDPILYPGVCISIRDQGCGMNVEQISRVSESFYRADTSGTTPGFGLGLTLVEKVIALHSGQWKIISQPGSGTEIQLYFKLSGV